MSINTSLLWFLPAELWFVWPLQPPQAYSYTKHMDFVAKSWKPQRGQNWLFNKCCPNKTALLQPGCSTGQLKLGCSWLTMESPDRGIRGNNPKKLPGKGKGRRKKGKEKEETWDRKYPFPKYPQGQVNESSFIQQWLAEDQSVAGVESSENPLSTKDVQRARIPWVYLLLFWKENKWKWFLLLKEPVWEAKDLLNICLHY